MIATPRFSRSLAVIAGVLLIAGGTACAPDGGGGTAPAARTVARVSLGDGPDTLTVGDSRGYTATVLDAAGAPIADRAVQYTLSPSAVAVVTSAGLVTAVAPGTATLTATVEGVQGTRPLVVQPRVLARIDFPSAVTAGVTLEVGATASGGGTLRDARGVIVNGVPLEYQSSAPTIASVDAAGNVRALAPGEAVISARADTVSARFPVRVIALSAALFPRTITTEVGMRGQLWALVRDQDGRRVPARSVAFSSSDSTVMSVNATGEVVARAPGTATLRALLNGTLTVTTAVTVQTAPTNTLRIALLFEPSVPDYLRASASRAARRAERLVLPGTPTWTPTAFNQQDIKTCYNGQTAQHSGDWQNITTFVTMISNTDAMAFGGPCIARGSRDQTIVEGFPAATVISFSAPLSQDLFRLLPTSASEIAFDNVMLHELIHGLGFLGSYFTIRNVVTPAATALETAEALAAASNLGYPPGPVRFAPDQSHWDRTIYPLEVISPSGGNLTPARLSLLTLVALKAIGMPVNMLAADITTAAELAGGGYGQGMFGPLTATAPNFPPPSAIVSRFQSLPAFSLEHDVLPAPARRP